MNKNKYAPLLSVTVIAPFLALINYLVLQFLLPHAIYKAFYYSIFVFYGFFALTTALLLAILIKLNDKKADQIGYFFLIGTTIKMGLSYAVMLPVLNQENINNNPEKFNFFIVFIIFLLIEVVFTYKLLESNDKSK